MQRTTTDLLRRLALVGAWFGAFASAYLLVDYVFGSGICLTGSGCDVVRASAFAYPLGIPTPLLGLGFYLAAVALLVVPGRRIAGIPTERLAAGWSIVGVAAMALLTAIEVFALRALCSWCLLSALGAALLAVGAIGGWHRGDPHAERAEARSSRTRGRIAAEIDRSRHDLRRFAAGTGALLGVALVALLALPALTSGTPDELDEVGAAERPRLGAGPVEVVVYSDFQCPGCALAAPLLTNLADEGAISLTYRYFPLVSIHPNAAPAAEAAQAAALQGAFWPFHDALFARQSAWARLPAADAHLAFEAVARDVGLDVVRWRADAASGAVAAYVDADRRHAEELQLSGTPTIFVDGVRHRGALTRGDLLRTVEAARAER